MDKTSMMNWLDIKTALLEYCHAYVEERVSFALAAIREAKEAGDSESKSSMGDKYETARAMARLEQEKYASRLDEAYKLKKALAAIDPDKTSGLIGPGSLVITDKGAFYLSISAGKSMVGGLEVFLVSPVTPVAVAMLSRKVGDKVTVNGRILEIKEVY